MNLFIVESPLQLLCAYEAISREKDYELLIRQTGRGLNDQHLITCAEYLNLDYQVFLLFPHKIKWGLVRNIPLWLRLWLSSYQNVYLGSVYSSALTLISKIIRSGKIQYLDDGAATIRAQAEMAAGKREIKNWFTFFNLMPLEDQVIKRHKFDCLNRLVCQRDYAGSYFIGQPVEIMKGINKEDYICVVKSIAKNYSEENPLIYIPHRIEDYELLKKYKNIRILRLDMPIELYFIKHTEKLPKEVYSFYSTALVSLKNLFPEVLASAIKINMKETANTHLKDVYEYMENNEIKVIEFL